jgi:hypothetical protein
MELHSPHPFIRRLGWNPFIVAVPLAYLGYTAYLKGFPVGRTAGAAFVAFWFGLSAFDAISRHRLLDWLYSDKDETAGGG